MPVGDDKALWQRLRSSWIDTCAPCRRVHVRRLRGGDVTVPSRSIACADRRHRLLFPPKELPDRNSASLPISLGLR